MINLDSKIGLSYQKIKIKRKREMSRKEPLNYYCPGCDAVKSSPGECPDCGSEFMAADAAPDDVAIRDFGPANDEEAGFDDDPTAVSWYSDSEAVETI